MTYIYESVDLTESFDFWTIVTSSFNWRNISIEVCKAFVSLRAIKSVREVTTFAKTICIMQQCKINFTNIAEHAIRDWINHIDKSHISILASLTIILILVAAMIT